MEEVEYVYLVFRQCLCRVNLHKLSGLQPPMEKVVDFQKQGLPLGMGYFILDSKLYATGGEKLLKDAELLPGYNRPSFLDVSDGDAGLNTDVFVFDPSCRATPFKVDRSIAPMRAGKTGAKVATIDGKVYIFSGSPYCFGAKLPTPEFECLNPTVNSWDALCEPPFYKKNMYGREFSSFEHYVMHRKIYVKHRSGLYFYDVDAREWRDSRSVRLEYAHLPSPVPYPFHIPGCVAEGDDGLIIAYTIHGIVAYIYDSNGTLKRYQKLQNLNESLPIPDAELSAGFIRHLGDGKFCFVLSAYFGVFLWAIHLLTFQVETCSSNDNGGDDFLNAVLLHYHIYDGASTGSPDSYHVKDVLVMCERSKKHGFECVDDGGFKKQKRP